ncbi:hypothetical protein J6I39_05125 [bacterium]|nr:hypothetical protein [bacterium]
MRKFILFILILLLNFLTIEPVLAEINETQESDTPVFTAAIEDEKVFLSPKTTYILELESDLDINETNLNDEIFFSLISKVKASNGVILPEHTRFAGKFVKIKKSSPMFKRARAYIIVDKIIFPNEQVYSVRMEPKNGSDLKSSQLLNALRVIPAGIGVAAFSVISVAVVAIESVSIVGLVVVPRTCKGFGILISSLAKGLNYKLKAGSTIKFKLDTPVYIKASDILSK